jgi:hypothetical protein
MYCKLRTTFLSLCRWNQTYGEQKKKSRWHRSRIEVKRKVTNDANDQRCFPCFKGKQTLSRLCSGVLSMPWRQSQSDQWSFMSIAICVATMLSFLWWCWWTSPFDPLTFDGTYSVDARLWCSNYVRHPSAHECHRFVDVAVETEKGVIWKWEMDNALVAWTSHQICVIHWWESATAMHKCPSRLKSFKKRFDIFQPCLALGHLWLVEVWEFWWTLVLRQLW